MKSSIMYSLKFDDLHNIYDETVEQDLLKCSFNLWIGRQISS